MTTMLYGAAILYGAVILYGAAIVTAVPADKEPLYNDKAEDSFQHHIEAISEVKTRQKRAATMREETSIAELLYKITHMQGEMDDLSLSIIQIRATNTDLINRISSLEMSVTQCQRPCADERVSLNASSPLPVSSPISAERREALSKELYNASEEGDADRIRQLVAEGANVEYRLTNGITPLHGAAINGHVDAVQALIELGAPLEAKAIDGNTPLYWAIRNNRVECVKLLLSAGASVNFKNMWDRTPLHNAARYGSPAMIELLIAAGADREAKDGEGKVPKVYARSDDVEALL